VRQIAIIGKAAAARLAAPFGNKAWEIWALGFDTVPRIDRRFELHNEDVLEEFIEGEKVRDKLRREKCPVIMQRAHEDIPNSQAYPLAAIVKDIGKDYFGSTFGFMLAMAIHEKVDRIGIWGVDLNTTEEYAYQRPNAEFMIGIAMGRGIDVYLPPKTNLLRAPGRYGWDEVAYVDHIKATQAKLEQLVLGRMARSPVPPEAWEVGHAA
jgi:hypothetical protein